MDLHIPISYKGKTYTTCEIGKLKGGVIADATEEMGKKGAYAGMLKLIAGTLKSVSTEQGEAIERDFEGIIRRSTIQEAEILSLFALTQEEDAGIEQVSICPRCRNQVIYEDIGEDSEDDCERNALHFSDLEVIPFTKEQKIVVDLEDPVSIKKTDGEIILEVTSIDFRYPLLIDAIKGAASVSEKKSVRQTYAIYCQAITHVNGDEVEAKFRTTWGMFVLERMCRADLEKISKAMKNCGIQKTIKRECKCGKKWTDIIDLSSFFESGLQL